MASVEVLGADPGEARAFLAAVEAGSGVPPVDEDELRRLDGAPPVRDPGWDWGAHLAVVDGRPAAYAGVRLAPRGTAGGVARVDVAVDRTHPHAQDALGVVLADLREHAARRGLEGGVEAWLRGPGDAELATAVVAGFTERGRLHVLGRDLGRDLAGGADPSAASPRALPGGLRLRPFDADAPADAQAVVRLLGRAYPDLAAWYGDGFAVLTSTAWFRADDLLLLEEGGAEGRADGRAEGGALLGLHWMKRRGGAVGEVYNLAVDPDAQGRGIGPLLLDVGLAHLAATGCREVVLWVDAANGRALDLYRSRGFTPHWDDVSLAG